MFTLIEQYKRLFNNICFSSIERIDRIEAADTDNDGILTGSEFNVLSRQEKLRIQRDMGEENLQNFIASSKLEYRRLQEQRGEVIDDTRIKGHEHSDSIEGEADIFSGGLIRPGQSGRRVRALQEALSTWFKSHTISGDYDQLTVNAVAGLQNYYNENSGQASISEDGIFGNEGRTALRWMQENHGHQSRNTLQGTSVNREQDEVGIEASQQQINYPPQGREATIALQQLIGTPADGAFGPNSRRALQIFLRDRGLYSGPIDADIGRGSRAAIDAYNRGGASSRGEVGQAQERTRSASGTEAMRSSVSRRARPILEALQEVITPAVNSRADFQTLTRSIFEMQRRGQFDANVWNQFIALAQAQGWNDFLAHVSGTGLSDQDKYMILTNGIAESAMGGRGIFELLNRPGVTISELVAYETNSRKGAMLDVLSNQSGIPRNALDQARSAWIAQAPQSFSSSVFTRGEVFSTRRQQRGDGVLEGLQPFLNHSVVSLSGRQDYIPLSYEAPQLVNSLSDLAVQNVRDYIRRNGGPSFTLEQIRQNLAARRTVQGVTFDYELGYFKSADCFNDAIGVIPKITVPRRETGGSGNNDGPGNPGGPAPTAESATGGHAGNNAPAADATADASVGEE